MVFIMFLGLNVFSIYYCNKNDILVNIKLKNLIFFKNVLFYFFIFDMNL